MTYAFIEFRTGLSDYSDIPHMIYDWEYSVYSSFREELPRDTPEVLGKPVILTHCAYTNLYHDILIGRAVTGILHFLTQTPISWWSKKQATAKNLHAHQNSWLHGYVWNKLLI